MSLEAQTIVDAMAAADETTALSVIQAILESRPELAPSVVSFLIPDVTFPPAKALTENRQTGKIKRMDPKGFGFIECKELAEVFGGDVFLNSAQANGLSAGQEVSFAVMLSKDNKPQAYDVTSASGGKGSWQAGKGAGKGSSDGEEDWGAMMGMMASMMEGFGEGGGGGWKGDGKGKDDKGFGKKGKPFTPAPGKPDEAETVGDFQGTIKSFNEHKGYGFISCPDLQEAGCPNDVFLHHQQLAGFSVHDTVQFTVYMNSKGQPQAKDLVAPGGSAPKKAKMW
jgi:cold shock CspA family protein